MPLAYHSTILQGIGISGTAVASVMAAYATYQSRRIEQKSSNREETQQAFDLQDIMMRHVQEDNERLRQRQDEMHQKVNEVVGKLGIMTSNHQKCESDLHEHKSMLKEQQDKMEQTENRLRIAEAKIAELGG